MATLYDTIANSTDITAAFSGKQTHIDRHINQSPTDMLDRVLSQNVSHSAFCDKQTMNDAVKHLMLQEYANLKNWLHNTNQKVFKLSGPESHPVGSGLIHPSFQRNNKLIAVQTNLTTIMLLRDNTAAYGFSLLTAYPDTNTTTAVYDPNLQKQLINALPQTQTYQNGSGTYKTFLEDRLDPASRTCCRYDAANDEIQAYAWSPRYIHRLCITDKNIRYESRPNKPKTTYTTSSAQLENWLKINHPKIIKFAETIQNKIRTYTGYQPNRPLPAAPMPSSPQNQPSPSP